MSITGGAWVMFGLGAALLSAGVFLLMFAGLIGRGIANHG